MQQLKEEIHKVKREMRKIRNDIMPIVLQTQGKWMSKLSSRMFYFIDLNIYVFLMR